MTLAMNIKILVTKEGLSQDYNCSPGLLYDAGSAGTRCAPDVLSWLVHILEATPLPYLAKTCKSGQSGAAV